MYVTCTNACLSTNDEGFRIGLGSFISGYLSIPNPTNNSWLGYNPVTDPLGSLHSFQIPLYTNVTIITNSTYRFNGGAPSLTTNLALDYEQNVVNPITVRATRSRTGSWPPRTMFR